MKGIIRKAEKTDIDYISENAREADVKEAFLMSGKHLKDIFSEAGDIHDNSFVWEVDGKLICIYGVNPIDKKIGVIWLIATDDFEKYSVTFGRECKDVFKNLINGYDYLFNYVHNDHKKALQWLKWLGCKVCEPEPIGINKELFCKFEVRNV